MATRANSLVHRRSEPVCSVTFSLDNDLILSGSDDKGIRIWNARTGESVDMPVEHTDSVLSVACSPDNKRYAAASRDGNILVGDILPGPRFGKPTVRTIYDGPILSIAFSKDESCLVTSCGRTIGSWNTHSLEAVGPTFKEHKGSVTEIALARRGDLHLVACISNSDDKTIRLFNLKTADEVTPAMKGHQSSILSIACSPGGDIIVSGSWGQTIRVWDGHTGKEIIKPIPGHTGPVRSVALFEFPNGTRIIASGSDDQTVRLWKAETGEPIGNPLKGHTDQVLSVGFSSNGEFVVSGSADGTIRLWGIKSLWSPQTSQPDFQGTVGTQSGSGRGPYSETQSSNLREARPWTLRDDGWIVDDEKLLFWVLPGLRHDSNRVLELSNHSDSLITCIDSREGAKSLDLAIGADWMTCTSPGR
ncbi:putative WD repeat-containing protein K04G11,4 [Caenorhabditis elegans] [Rhizoctonia solani]|uniref:Putative WD repeat-containing protein K04G11,4 [Caenorhabditis elegans] n=1 Tax=Rhizoctonia solani TaxID=456999 RepID=A0A0K6G2T3_9AGAM|nr:putative WD repeat-containing protein K04G11,4 [Caenorhabditis elegans] [Rhizoctonia solani]